MYVCARLCTPASRILVISIFFVIRYKIIKFQTKKIKLFAYNAKIFLTEKN